MTHAVKCVCGVCVSGFTTEGVRTKRVESTVMDEEIHFWEVFLHCHVHIKQRTKKKQTANLLNDQLQRVQEEIVTLMCTVKRNGLLTSTLIFLYCCYYGYVAI